MIRHAEPEDAKGIHDVALKSWKDTYSHILTEETIEDTINDWYSIEDLRKQTKHPVFYVAEVEEDLVGFVHITLEDQEATLHRIYIDPDYQGQGIGSRLYEKAEEEIREYADKVKLEVFAENRKGNNFYEKEGFKEEKTEEINFKGQKAMQKVLIKNLDN